MISKRSFSTLICAALGVPLDMAAALQEQDAQETLSALSSSNATFLSIVIAKTERQTPAVHLSVNDRTHSTNKNTET
jgi:hypothetical protein